MKRTTNRNLSAAIGAALVLASAAGCGQGKPAAPEHAAGSTPLLAGGAVVACNPNGAHPKHTAYACTTCHPCQGMVLFDPAGPAVRAGEPPPSYDPATQRCNSVACHGVAPGTFTYWFPDGSGDAVELTVGFGATLRPTPSWYTTTSIGCAACHDNPPRNGSDGSNIWHSGYHGNQGPTGARNQCQFCHPGSYSPNNGIGTINTARHDGRVDVRSTFTAACFGCH